MEKREGIHIVDVGPRDGLQNLQVFVSTEHKISLIRHLAASGIREIQAGGFVNPRAIPQFADIKTVISGILDLEDVTLNVMVPNLQGARDAIECGLKKIVFFFSVSRSHNLNNVRQTPEESLAALESIVSMLGTGSGVTIRVDLATVFGCPFEGFMTMEAILKSVGRVADLGIRTITLCDTVGFGNPKQVEEIISNCRGAFPDITFGVHFHDTRGLGLANALRAYDMGIRSFDSSIGGLGGCPFAPGASGNIATEDAVFMFSQMGIETGIDMTKLLSATAFLHQAVPEAPITSALFHAGTPKLYRLGETPNQTQKGEQTSC
jgi:hydroxymethylglutaryl-CoA lyase